MDLTSKQKLHFWTVVSIIILVAAMFAIWFSIYDQSEEYKAEEIYLSDELGLTTVQQKLFEKFNVEYSEITDSINQQKKIIIDKIFQTNSNKPKVDKMLNEVTQLNLKIDETRFNYLVKLKSLLNTDQVAGLKKIAEEALIYNGDSLYLTKYKLTPSRPRKIF